LTNSQIVKNAKILPENSLPLPRNPYKNWNNFTQLWCHCPCLLQIKICLPCS